MNNSSSFKNRLLKTAVALGAGLVVAQAAPPAAPYVAPIKSGDAWEVALQPAEKKTESSDGAKLKSISGKRAEQTRMEKFVWSDKETERWLIGRTLYEKSQDGNRYITTRFARGAAAVEQRLSELAELTWIAPAHFKGIAKAEDRDCFYYEYTQVVSLDDDESPKSNNKAPEVVTYHRKAWIDVSTKRPVVFENDDYRFTYTFSTFSPALLDPPAAILSQSNNTTP